jgi:hypothetical protein
MSGRPAVSSHLYAAAARHSHRASIPRSMSALRRDVDRASESDEAATRLQRRALCSIRSSADGSCSRLAPARPCSRSPAMAAGAAHPPPTRRSPAPRFIPPSASPASAIAPAATTSARSCPELCRSPQAASKTRPVRSSDRRRVSASTDWIETVGSYGSSPPMRRRSPGACISPMPRRRGTTSIPPSTSPRRNRRHVATRPMSVRRAPR